MLSVLQPKHCAISHAMHTEVAEVINTCCCALRRARGLTCPVCYAPLPHPCLQVAEVIRQVLVRLTQAYPDHMLWSCAAVTRSANAHRRSLAAEMLRSVRQGCGKDRAGAELRGRIEAFAALADQLIRLCHWQPPPVRGSSRAPTEASVATEFAALLRALPVDVSGGVVWAADWGWKRMAAACVARGHAFGWGEE